MRNVLLDTAHHIELAFKVTFLDPRAVLHRCQEAGLQLGFGLLPLLSAPLAAHPKKEGAVIGHRTVPDQRQHALSPKAELFLVCVA